MVVVPLLWLRQQLVIHCRMNCETRISTVASATFRRNLKTFNSVSTIPGTLSALEALCDYARYINLHLHYITLHYITRPRPMFLVLDRSCPKTDGLRPYVASVWRYRNLIITITVDGEN